MSDAGEQAAEARTEVGDAVEEALKLLEKFEKAKPSDMEMDSLEADAWYLGLHGFRRGLTILRASVRMLQSDKGGN